MILINERIQDVCVTQNDAMHFPLYFSGDNLVKKLRNNETEAEELTVRTSRTSEDLFVPTQRNWGIVTEKGNATDL